MSFYLTPHIFRGGGGGGGVQTPPGSGKHPRPHQKMLRPPKKIGIPPRNFTDFQYSQLQLRLFHYDEIILTAKAYIYRY